jgi:hypothetical protein
MRNDFKVELAHIPPPEQHAQLQVTAAAAAISPLLSPPSTPFFEVKRRIQQWNNGKEDVGWYGGTRPSSPMPLTSDAE